MWSHLHDFYLNWHLIINIKPLFADIADHSKVIDSVFVASLFVVVLLCVGVRCLNLVYDLAVCANSSLRIV